MFIMFSVGLELELRSSCLQSIFSTAWTTPPVHFAQLILEMGAQEWTTSFSFQPPTAIFLTSASQVYRITGRSHRYFAWTFINFFVFVYWWYVAGFLPFGFLLCCSQDQMIFLCVFYIFYFLSIFSSDIIFHMF
jgi:hypothetical protein